MVSISDCDNINGDPIKLISLYKINTTKDLQKLFWDVTKPLRPLSFVYLGQCPKADDQNGMESKAKAKKQSQTQKDGEKEEKANNRTKTRNDYLFFLDGKKNMDHKRRCQYY